MRQYKITAVHSKFFSFLCLGCLALQVVPNQPDDDQKNDDTFLTRTCYSGLGNFTEIYNLMNLLTEKSLFFTHKVLGGNFLL